MTEKYRTKLLGAEALSGLARAFFYAGARALLVSHWPVVSDPAVKLMTTMFAAIAKDPKLATSEALRQAMLLVWEPSFCVSALTLKTPDSTRSRSGELIWKP
jgi:CHAT domain-containing protein